MLRDFAHNKSLDTTPDLRATMVMHIVFQEVALFLVKYHNHLDSNLEQLCKDCYTDHERMITFLIDWIDVTPENMPSLWATGDGSERLTKAALGRSFASIVSARAIEATPEKRIFIRESWFVLRCWKIKIPEALAGKYLGNQHTVKTFVKNFPDEDCCKCLDAQTVHQFSALLLRRKDQRFEQITPASQLPDGGCIYTMCSVCLRNHDNTQCKCYQWLRTCCTADEAPRHMEEVKLNLDEIIIPEHCSNMVLGPPAHTHDESEGALNLRQFSLGRINAVAGSFLDAKHLGPSK